MRGVPDIVCVSTNEWSGLPTSKQHLMSVFARRGRVLYVDPPIDAFSFVGRRRRWRKPWGLRRADDGPWVLSPVVLTSRSDPVIRLGLHRRLAPRVARAAEALGFARPVVWVFAPEHVPHTEAFPGSLVVYHAADEPRTFSPRPEETADQERAIMARADLIFVASRALLDARRGTGKAVRLPNAADKRHYARIIAGDAEASIDEFMAALVSPRRVPPELRAAYGPIVLFGGAAYAWFDDALLRGLAAARPDWRFVLVGPISRRLASVGFPGNVRAIGRRPYDEFPWYVVGADVAILPIAEGETFRHCDPIVLYEYLLCGKPVVATPFPAALERGTLVRTADSPEGFAKEIEEALAERGGPDAVRPRVEFAFSNTWERRAEEALGMIAPRVAEDAARLGRPGPDEAERAGFARESREREGDR